jgi:hypothetical protein
MKSIVLRKPDTAVADALVDVLSVRPLDLPCARCGRSLSAHAGEPPDCTGFVRPTLPPDFAYIDQLTAGDAFHFISRRTTGRARTAARAPFDLDAVTGLFQLESHSQDSGDVIHLVERNTIVALPTLSHHAD